MPKKTVSEIRIDPRRCKGCEICVAFCPAEVLALRDEKAVVINLSACTACELCVLRCPDFAVELFYADPAVEEGPDHG